MNKTKLEMEFLDGDGKNFVISLDNPRPDLTAAEASQAMTNILNANVFNSKTFDLVEGKEARVITTSIEILK